MELRSSDTSSNSSNSSVGSYGSTTSSGSYKYKGKKYGGLNKKDLVRCSAKTLSGKGCSRKCEKNILSPTTSVCYQHSMEGIVNKMQKEFFTAKQEIKSLKNKQIETDKIINDLIKQIENFKEDKKVYVPSKSISKCKIIENIIVYSMLFIYCIFLIYNL